MDAAEGPVREQRDRVARLRVANEVLDDGVDARVGDCLVADLLGETREIEALGCRVRYTLEELGSADVVYALRMQRERMTGAFVPSLREYAARYQIDARRLGPTQLLMHPGPVNRGVELSAEVIDSPQALIAEQVESGVVVRMAVLYELLAGRGAPSSVREGAETEPQPA